MKFFTLFTITAALLSVAAAAPLAPPTGIPNRVVQGSENVAPATLPHSAANEASSNDVRPAQEQAETGPNPNRPVQTVERPSRQEPSKEQPYSSNFTPFLITSPHKNDKFARGSK